MNVRDWPMNQIMQLPDCCFGRREIAQLSTELADADPVFVINPGGLAERTVIWEIGVTNRGTIATTTHVTLALGDQLPATQAEFAALEVMFPNVIASDGGRGEFETQGGSYQSIFKVRQIFATAGRRIVARIIRHIGVATEAAVVITYSSIPTEVPDCLFSA